ncbi:MAG TPA: hypothetical protein VMM36_14275 [Opitutaceae bacterium]|nr:hypothetical protein [Opitutaceae bacterium]
MAEHRPQISKPTLENLLELKRHERPPEAFWNAFDSRLREKQLAALIPVESGWSRWYLGIGRFAKFGLPMAAAAAVVVGIVSFNRQSLNISPSASPDRSVENRDLTSASASAADMAEVADPVDSGIRTVVIEAAPQIAEGPSNKAMDAEQIARTLPWLANVDFKRDSKNESGINLVEPLNVDRGPTALAMASFENNKPNAQPVWAPTEQNLRQAVASEIGISSPVVDKSNRAWMTRLVAGNSGSSFSDSRIESEYPRELTRVGLTSSTLSIKF